MADNSEKELTVKKYFSYQIEKQVFIPVLIMN
jgi:hypothetical protein